MRLAVEQVRQRLRAQRPCRKVRDAPPRVGNAGRAAAWVAGASLREAPARVAREAKIDQDQVVEIPRFRVRKAGDYRTVQADRQQFPTSAGFQDKQTLSYGFMICSRQGVTAICG